MIRKKIITLLPILTLLLTGCGGSGSAGLNSNSGSEPAAGSALPATSVNNETAASNEAGTSSEIGISSGIGTSSETEVIHVSAFNTTAPEILIPKREAFRLLEQATFGAQLKDIDSLAGKNPEPWIDEQLSLPATLMTDGLNNAKSDRWNEYVNVWWRLALNSDDQLRQRVAFALSEIFVISTADGLGHEQLGLANYYDILIRNAFGNYRELIEEITLNPVMGEYLSMKGNHKPDPELHLRPDENYARELLQLFSIGLSMLNEDGTIITDAEGYPVPTYDQDIVEGFAHVFTGWHFANAEHFRWPKNSDYVTPMVLWPDKHATGEKTLLNGFIVKAGQSAEQDLADALDNVANHPNVGPFIVRHLITKLVTSNPSAEYIRDVVQVYNQNDAGERGNLGSTVKAILMHKEARQGHLLYPDRFGKTKEPILRVTQLWRAFAPKDGIHPEFTYSWVSDELQQAPLASPSVFNFYTPNFSQPGAIRDGGFVSPEFEILDETSIISMTSRLMINSVWSHNYKSTAGESSNIAINIDREMDIEHDRDAFLNHLDILLLGGRMSSELRLQVSQLMDARTYDNAASQRVSEAIFLISSSPEAAIQL